MTGAVGNAWSAKRQVIIGLACLALLLGGFGTWAMTTRIAGAIVAPGRIEVDRNRQIVQHEKGGVVDVITVVEGDRVAAGDVLIRLDPQTLASQLTIAQKQLFELMARRGRLNAQRDEAPSIIFDAELIRAGMADPDVGELIEGQKNLFAARRASVAQEIDQMGKRGSQIASEIEGIEAQKVSLQRQLFLIEQELASQQSLLQRGLTQATTVSALAREQARLQGRIGELSANTAQAEGRATEIDIEILKLGTAGREEAITRLRDLRYQELELVEQCRALRLEIEQLDIRAPVSGIVYAMQVQTPRSVIRPAEILLYLVPQDRPLVVTTRVTPNHVDQITIGQQVNLRMPALDQRNTPELQGQVNLVSADAIEDEQSGQLYFRVDITLNTGELEKLPDGVILLPGMPVEAFMRTSDRSPMSYLIKPMTDYFARAFRES